MGVRRIPEVGRDGGFSLLEMAVAVSLLLFVTAVVGKNIYDSSRASSSLVKLKYMNLRAQTVIDRLADELITGNFTSMIPETPVAADYISFQKIVGVNNGEPVFGNTIQIDLVPMESDINDGVDNNKNGLVDECGIRIWEDLPPGNGVLDPTDPNVVVCGKVPRGGLKFTRQGAMLLIDLTVQEVVEIGEPPKSFQIVTGVKMRNSEGT